MPITTEMMEEVNELAEINTQLVETAQVSLIPYSIQNVTWPELCSRITNFKTPSVPSERPFFENQLLVLDYHSNPILTRMIMTTASHKIPFMDDANITIKTSTSRRINEKGLVLIQTHNTNNVGMLVFIPFANGKKICGFFTMSNGPYPTYLFFHVEQYKESDNIIPIVLPNVRPRLLASRLDDTDRVHLSNASSKFDRANNSMDYVEDMIIYLQNQMLDTIDPSYMFKIMELNKNMLYPTRTIADSPIIRTDEEMTPLTITTNNVETDDLLGRPLISSEYDNEDQTYVPTAEEIQISSDDVENVRITLQDADLDEEAYSEDDDTDYSDLL